MKARKLTPAVLVIAALVGACSTTPKTTGLLDQARSAYGMAQDNPQVTSYAAAELKQAGDALELANAAARKNDSAEQIDKLAYVARQKIALTQEVASRKSAEAEIANAGQERDQIRLAQRTLEADQARINAEQARQVARIAVGNAMEAERQTELSRADAAQAQRQTLDAQARAADLEAQLADLAARKTERGMVITLGDVLFGTDLAQLTADGMRTAEKLAAVLQRHPQRTVLIEGFTDSTGSVAHNQELSERRSTSVRSALQHMGVASERIAVRGYGETFPITANDTARNRQLNRRVEIVVSNGVGQIPQR